MNKFSKKTYGFTLVELMVTIAIAAILMMVAVPSYTDFIKRNTVESLQSRLSAAVVTARTEAASRNVTTTLCASNNGTSCTGATTWSGGWIVFADVNADQTVTAAVDTVILVYLQPSADYPVMFRNDAAAAVAGISFANLGFTRGSVRAFATLCEPKKDVKYARGLTIERSGRVMKSSDSADTGTTHDIVFDTGTAVAPTPVDITCP